MQNLASIPPRTSLSKFGGDSIHFSICFLRDITRYERFRQTSTASTEQRPAHSGRRIPIAQKSHADSNLQLKQRRTSRAEFRKSTPALSRCDAADWIPDLQPRFIIVANTFQKNVHPPSAELVSGLSGGCSIRYHEDSDKMLLIHRQVLVLVLYFEGSRLCASACVFMLDGISQSNVFIFRLEKKYKSDKARVAKFMLRFHSVHVSPRSLFKRTGTLQCTKTITSANFRQSYNK